MSPSSPTRPHRLDVGADERANAVRASVQSLFRHCAESQNPVLAFSKACSKIGYLARDGVRSELHYLEAALNEQKHAIISRRHGDPSTCRQHTTECAQSLVAFMGAVRRGLDRPRDPPKTLELTARIERNLEAGQWVRASKDLDELARRSDFRQPLPRLDSYPRAHLLRGEIYQALERRIERCNAAALGKTLPRDPTASTDRRGFALTNGASIDKASRGSERTVAPARAAPKGMSLDR